MIKTEITTNWNLFGTFDKMKAEKNDMPMIPAIFPATKRNPNNSLNSNCFPGHAANKENGITPYTK